MGNLERVEDKEDEAINIENEVLKELLDGKLEKGIITSIYGAAGTGKTTLSIQLSKEIIEKEGKVAYIDTESGFSIERAKQIIGEEKLDRILIGKAFSFDELQTVIESLKEEVKEKEIKGVVIDSISQPYRVEDREVQEINKLFSRLFYILTKTAKEFNIPIITTNQVYSEFSTNNLEIVGRDIPKYASKTMIFLKNEEKRIAILKKHRYLEKREVVYTIRRKGIVKVK